MTAEGYYERAKEAFSRPYGMYDSSPMDVQGLADVLGCARSTAYRIIKRLEAEGFLDTFEEVRMGPGGYPQAWSVLRHE